MATREIPYQVPDLQRRFAKQMADYIERVSERVIRAREQAGYDREPFALKANISPKQLKRIEDGESHPRRATLRKIAHAADVPLNFVMPDLDEDQAQLDQIEEKLDALLDWAIAANRREAVEALRVKLQEIAQRSEAQAGDTPTGRNGHQVEGR